MDSEPHSRTIVLRASILELSLAAVALVLAKILDVSLISQINAEIGAILVGFAASIPLLGMAAWIARSQLGPFQHLMRRVRELLVPMFRACSAGDLLLVALVAGFSEELLFRGVMQTGLAAVVGSLPALAITAGVFGALHALTAAYGMLAFIVGLYLGSLALWSGGLVAPMVTHAFYDWIALTWLVRSGRTGDALEPLA